MNEIINKVIQWGADRDLLRDEVKDKQLLKCVEEVGELCRSHLKQDMPGIIDGLGDVLVTLILFAEQNNISLEHCLLSAYNEIKDRTGKTVNNTFIKDTK
jgi:NTP pyrophosphatase (non-canonical NTP hydrolase)